MTAKWNIRNIYLYLVCLITLVIFIFAISHMASGLVEIFYQRPVANYYEKPSTDSNVDDKANREKMVEIQRQQDRYYAIKRTIESGIMIFVVVPIYIYHWRKIEKQTE